MMLHQIRSSKAGFFYTNQSLNIRSYWCYLQTHQWPAAAAALQVTVCPSLGLWRKAMICVWPLLHFRDEWAQGDSCQGDTTAQRGHVNHQQSQRDGELGGQVDIPTEQELDVMRTRLDRRTNGHTERGGECKYSPGRIYVHVMEEF